MAFNRASFCSIHSSATTAIAKTRVLLNNGCSSFRQVGQHPQQHRHFREAILDAIGWHVENCDS